jgi:hypothetical protein
LLAAADEVIPEDITAEQNFNSVRGDTFGEFKSQKKRNHLLISDDGATLAIETFTTFATFAAFAACMDSAFAAFATFATFLAFLAFFATFLTALAFATADETTKNTSPSM